MPTLPSLDSLGARPVPVSNRQIASNDQAGAVGQALEGFGQTVYSVGQHEAERQDKVQWANAKTQVLSKSVELRQQLQTTPDYGNWQKNYEAQMAQVREQAAQSLSNHGDRALFNADVNTDIASGSADLSRAAFQRRSETAIAAVEDSADHLQDVARAAPDDQTRASAIKTVQDGYQGLVAQGLMNPVVAGERQRQWATKYVENQKQSGWAGATNAANDAVQSALNLPVSEQHLAILSAQVDKVGQLENWSPDQIKAEKDKRVSAARHDVLVTLNNSGPDGPRVAQAYLDQHRDQFTGDDAANAQAAIRVMANSQEAEVRRQEAEARRLAAEAKHDAGLRAQDVDQTVKEGGYVAPDVLSAAMRDAQTAERPALVESLKLGSLKNNLNLQYKDTPPAQIRNDLNTLGAKIAKAGQAATVEDRTAFEHLSTILSKTTSELNQDPISWGATHSGIDPGPLNLDDPKSIQAHITAGKAVAAHTGAPLRLMTNADAAILTSQMSTGDAGQRKAAIAKLARFGPLAPVAAAQIKPGDDAFANTVGLATAANPSVAAQHLDWITSGQEILKANPKLVNPKEADASFAAYTGNALELLPSVQRGALANAANMAAALAQHNGASDWASGGNDAFFKAQGDAFGGYHDAAGVQRGGIATINNRRTLLPDGWSRAEVETAIAKAPVNKWQSAQNGQPVDARGNVFNLGQLRQMQFVAVGDGRYRLTDGAHYVGKKGGGFFELDVRRMR